MVSDMRPCERVGTHRLRIAASDTSCSRTEEGAVEGLLLLSEHSSGQRLIVPVRNSGTEDTRSSIY